MKVLGVTGMPGSGKSVFIDTALEKYGIVVSMGDIIREKARERGEDTGTTAKKIREEFGQYIVSELTVERIKEILKEDNEADFILVDGIRSPYEVEMFKENFDNFSSVSIFACAQTRFERLVLRNRADDSDTYDGFLVRDNRELGFGLGEVIATADYLLVNEDSLEDFQDQVRNFLESQLD